MAVFASVICLAALALAACASKSILVATSSAFPLVPKGLPSGPFFVPIEPFTLLTLSVVLPTSANRSDIFDCLAAFISTLVSATTFACASFAFTSISFCFTLADKSCFLIAFAALSSSDLCLTPLTSTSSEDFTTDFNLPLTFFAAAVKVSPIFAKLLSAVCRPPLFLVELTVSFLFIFIVSTIPNTIT